MLGIIAQILTSLFHTNKRFSKFKTHLILTQLLRHKKMETNNPFTSSHRDDYVLVQSYSCSCFIRVVPLETHHTRATNDQNKASMAFCANQSQKWFLKFSTTSATKDTSQGICAGIGPSLSPDS